MKIYSSFHQKDEQATELITSKIHMITYRDLLDVNKEAHERLVSFMDQKMGLRKREGLINGDF